MIATLVLYQLHESLKNVEEAAAHINTLVAEQENIQSLLELQRSLQVNDPRIINPGRRLIKEGILMKMSPASDKSCRRYFVLMSDIIMYCKLKKSNPKAVNSLKCSCILPLNKCTITQVFGKGVFKITCQNEVIICYPLNPSDGEVWVKTLQESIKKYHESRQTLRKDSSSRRPVHKKHISEYNVAGVSPGHPRRKRKYDEQEFEYIVKCSENDSEDSDGDATKNCFVFKAKGRRPIREKGITSIEIPSALGNTNDSLFPMREYLGKIESKHSIRESRNTETNLKYNECLTYSSQMEITKSNANDVYVFGRHNGQRGFTFSMGNIFNGFKKLFGIHKSNV